MSALDRLEAYLEPHCRCEPEEGHCEACIILMQIEDEIDLRQRALDQIRAWARAYPLDVFPEPDWKRSAEVLKAAGLSLDRISASNMRHVITRVAEIASTPDITSPNIANTAISDGDASTSSAGAP